jgi:hypothetical protein
MAMDSNQIAVVKAYREFVRGAELHQCVSLDDVQWMIESKNYFLLRVVNSGKRLKIQQALTKLSEMVGTGEDREEALKEIGTQLGADLVIWKERAVRSAERRRIIERDDHITEKVNAMHKKDIPGRYYYSTQPFLAYCINHFFYGGIHYAYVGGKFYPYRKLNPKSSNPLLVYQDIYQPWRDADGFDKFITGLRMNLRKGVIAKATALGMTTDMRKRLKTICGKVSIDFLYPIVYRVDIDSIVPVSRRIPDGSAGAGSDEYKILDLQESEFTVLFDDYQVDPGLVNILKHNVPAGPNEQQDALAILEGRLTP